MTIGAIGFAAPWLLIALALLPILWVLLRAVPPAPVRRRFPGVALLLGLRDEDSAADRTPWWLLLLRMLALAAVIIGLAGPVLNPRDEGDAPGNRPLLIALDASWASARDDRAARALLNGVLAEAGRDGRTAAMIELSAPEAPEFQAASAWRTRLTGMAPAPWAPMPETMERAGTLLPEGPFDTLWLSDGLARDGREALLSALEARGNVTIREGTAPLLTLAPPQSEGGALELTVQRLAPGAARQIDVLAHGRDPAGAPRVLATLPITLEEGAREGTGALSLPAELRARVTRFEIAGQGHAGAVQLVGDALGRREVALIAGREDREGLELLSPLHYLSRALAPTADLLTGNLMDVLPANPDAIVLADVATLSPGEAEGLRDWAEEGGTLVRFAGPRLAASDVSRRAEDPLMPVRLRAGGRSVGGAMSWGAPKSLAPFAEDSPFAGLAIPDDVTVTSQVMAQPDPTLAERVIAQLGDGTPLVTRKRIGQGQVVLFHVTANAEWSSLPLSGLFVQMLERLAIADTDGVPAAEELAGTTWQPAEVLDGYGILRSGDTMPGVAGERLLEDDLGPDLRPGLYKGEERRIARNIMAAGAALEPAAWPARANVIGLDRAEETPLMGWLLAAALLLLSVDILASLGLSGRLLPARAAAVVAALLMLPDPGTAQDRVPAALADEVTLAYVLTGDAPLDDLSEAGLEGLGQTLFFRTTVEPAAPQGVDLETDELAFFPLLYWPISPAQAIPSDAAYAKLNAYLRSGGMILFDTRDADVAGFGASSPNGAMLQRLAQPLDIPPLEPVPNDHVLTRGFYLLQDFPGRYSGRPVWVEAAPEDAEAAPGMPFRNLNDGVTPVVIGGNDWAAAWAIDANGNAQLPVGRGYAGERQREMAYRFGVNLVMHVLTGNYKSDQVHVPALLDRLGQ
ncbi:N-terminal double-transmembrane domain-containing protein [Roseovarius nanhaiticus]|uniref:N-terminal double-transmembrane domain-containing protein n=1 Tax=Roseovarius nanhaiticus TaxID=573024 RepID=A0A1N7GZV8_9RHOB|nr:DUF4159 domain-containing protein [Roseovarius nanhaiticus]SEL18445.1 N-terminal double-transmembrane domain-containing protein [Roseovarius nanhaiticus]SIS18066.1 N-terminal double-transmembrane domain-containing protein [Roseovarius nanhaiticus]